jgi:hypothetical protein
LYFINKTGTKENMLAQIISFPLHCKLAFFPPFDSNAAQLCLRVHSYEPNPDKGLCPWRQRRRLPLVALPLLFDVVFGVVHGPTGCRIRADDGSRWRFFSWRFSVHRLLSFR